MRNLLTALLLCCSPLALATVQTQEIPYTSADARA